MILVEAYFLNNKDVNLALRWYGQKYRDRQAPTRFVLKRMVENLKNTGSFKKRRQTLQENNFDFDLSVLTYFESFLKASSRDAAEVIGITHTRVLKVLKKYKYKCSVGPKIASWGL